MCNLRLVSIAFKVLVSIAFKVPAGRQVEIIWYHNTCIFLLNFLGYV
jgi:hypothetical protein